MSQLTIETNQEIAQRAIKNYFDAGGILTVQKAFWKFHTTELRKIVCRLKNQGMPIVSKKVPGESYNEYWKDKEVAA